MIRTNAQLAVPDIETRSRNEVILSDDSRSMISGGGRAEEIVNQARASINEVLQASSAQIRGAVEHLKDTIKSCEAKISGTNKIQVIIKPDELIFSVEQSFEVLKDK